MNAWKSFWCFQIILVIIYLFVFQGQEVLKYVGLHVPS